MVEIGLCVVLTGYLVLSILYINDVVDSVLCLIDMGVFGYLVVSVVCVVVV